jgi:Family of unknown function (DUF6364)
MALELSVEVVMVHLTIALEEDVLEKARQKAREQGTSIDELLRSYLASYAVDQQQKQSEVVRSLLDLSSKARSGSGGQKWTRDELYDR